MKILIGIVAVVLSGCASSGTVLPSKLNLDDLTMQECRELVKTESGKDSDLIEQQKENAKIYKECKETNELKLNVLRSLSSK